MCQTLPLYALSVLLCVQYFACLHAYTCTQAHPLARKRIYKCPQVCINAAALTEGRKEPGINERFLDVIDSCTLISAESLHKRYSLRQCPALVRVEPHALTLHARSPDHLPHTHRLLQHRPCSPNFDLDDPTSPTRTAPPCLGLSLVISVCFALHPHCPLRACEQRVQAHMRMHNRLRAARRAFGRRAFRLDLSQMLVIQGSGAWALVWAALRHCLCLVHGPRNRH